MSGLELLLAIVAVVLVVLLTCGAAWLAIERARLQRSRAERAAAQHEVEQRTAEATAALREREAKYAALVAHARELQARLEEREKAHAARMAEIDAARVEQREQLEEERRRLQAQFREAIEAAAGRALEATSEQMLKLANERLGKQQEASQAALGKLVGPIGETLKRADEKLGALEKARTTAYAELRQQIELVMQGNAELRGETGRLVAALRRPHVRGQYGEVQLRRVAELAGMTAYCDFALQSTTRDADGRALRPDMVVQLPNDRQIAVDAKTSIDAYLDAANAPNEEDAEGHLRRFAKHVLAQATDLGKKQYWSQYDGSPEFTVMFIPGDQFVDAALAREPKLLELAAERNVLLASPSTLIGLLRAVAVGWREKALSDSARELFELGRELHKRSGKVLEYAAQLGESLDTATQRYNQFVRSVDSRLLPQLRRFEEAGARASKSLAEPKQVDFQPEPIRTLPEAES